MTVSITYASRAYAARRPNGFAETLRSLLRRIWQAMRAAGRWFTEGLEMAEKYAPYYHFTDPNRGW